MAYWVVRQALDSLDIDTFAGLAATVAARVERQIGKFYITTCTKCNLEATVKYFLWVKTLPCPGCGTRNDLFPGFLLAEAVRHPKNVVVCPACDHLNEYDAVPQGDSPAHCEACNAQVTVEGIARRHKITCTGCAVQYKYPPPELSCPLDHRMWAIEYHCEYCKPNHQGRFFKAPDADDLARYKSAQAGLRRTIKQLPIPDDEIPTGDETKRLHRWGYTHYRQLFNDRQLLGLGILLTEIQDVADPPIRHALLTVFSDFLRYQNLLCRYDTYALKCQDIFSVHGFPVGLVQCENNILGIPKVGSGCYRHFVEKYRKAKEYAQAPFETATQRNRKNLSPTPGEFITANFTESVPTSGSRNSYLVAGDAASAVLPDDSLDGVFTDPPYFNNVQYAELMDFCYAWLRPTLAAEFQAFRPETTRAHEELTGNETMGRGLEHFSYGISAVFRRFADALKQGAPFVFTYHHNDPKAYAPIILGLLDAKLACTQILTVPAEMGASLHIARANSSVLDSVFVCRRVGAPAVSIDDASETIMTHLVELERAGLRITKGDIRCLVAGVVASLAVNELLHRWIDSEAMAAKLDKALETLSRFANALSALTDVQDVQSQVAATRTSAWRP